MDDITATDDVEDIKEHVLEIIEDALADDNGMLQITRDMNDEPRYISHQTEAIGVEANPITDIEYRTENIDIDLRIREGREFISYED